MLAAAGWCRGRPAEASEPRSQMASSLAGAGPPGVLGPGRRIGTFRRPPPGTGISAFARRRGLSDHVFDGGLPNRPGFFVAPPRDGGAFLSIVSGACAEREYRDYLGDLRRVCNRGHRRSPVSNIRQFTDLGFFIRVAASAKNCCCRISVRVFVVRPCVALAEKVRVRGFAASACVSCALGGGYPPHPFRRGCRRGRNGGTSRYRAGLRPPGVAGVIVTGARR